MCLKTAQKHFSWIFLGNSGSSGFQYKTRHLGYGAFQDVSTSEKLLVVEPKDVIEAVVVALADFN